MSEYVTFMKKYSKLHAACPNCFGTSFSTTLAGYILDLNHPELYKNLNSTTCLKCGWKGTVHDRIPATEEGESVWLHKKHNRLYRVISENAKQKDPETGEWRDCVIYAPLYENEIEMFSREKGSFYLEFEKKS